MLKRLTFVAAVIAFGYYSAIFGSYAESRYDFTLLTLPGMPGFLVWASTLGRRVVWGEEWTNRHAIAFFNALIYGLAGVAVAVGVIRKARSRVA